VEKYGTAGQVTDDNVNQCVCFACWITKARNVHSAYVICNANCFSMATVIMVVLLPPHNFPVYHVKITACSKLYMSLGVIQ
jgi:hypothetical protein